MPSPGICGNTKLVFVWAALYHIALQHAANSWSRARPDEYADTPALLSQYTSTMPVAWWSLTEAQTAASTFMASSWVM